MSFSIVFMFHGMLTYFIIIFLWQKAQVKPIIRSLHITTDIKNRYATTLVSTRVINPLNQSGEATFTVTLPESAFISEFLM